MLGILGQQFANGSLTSADLNRKLYPTWTAYTLAAHSIDANNKEAHPMCYDDALESAYQLGLSGHPLSSDVVFDLLDEWHTCRTIRGMSVTLGDTGIAPPAPCYIHRVLNALVGTMEYAPDSWDKTYIPGSAEAMFATLPKKHFLAWFWIEYLSIQVQQDGNKRAGAILLLYWVGRLREHREYILPDNTWALCLLESDSVTALAALL